jgi:hypothetical protein
MSGRPKQFAKGKFKVVGCIGLPAPKCRQKKVGWLLV